MNLDKESLMNTVVVETGVSESEQIGSHQNGTLQTAVEGIAMTVETHIKVPHECTTESDVEDYVKSLAPKLLELGINLNVSIGEED